MTDTASEELFPDNDTPRKVEKRKDVEKEWRKGTARWRYSGIEESEHDFVEWKRNAPPKYQLVRPENERDALVIETGGPLVTLVDGDEEFRAKPRRSTTSENPQGTLVTIGDRVRYIMRDHGDALVTHVYKRRTELVRTKILSREYAQVLVANIDQLVVVTAATAELFRTGLIDRYLIAAAMGGFNAVICINKMDLVDEEDLVIVQETAAVYRNAGYIVVLTSCITLEGIEALHNLLREKVSAFSGHSGVGKTSLLNSLVPEADEKTQDVSEQSRRGTHTTTKSVLYELPNGGYIADTPGIREFGLFHFHKNDLHTYYPDFIPFSDRCRFPSCTHTHEPDCAVLQAVEDQLIHPLRYKNYLQILESEENDAEQ